jgi:tetrahydromethanopterin S-methyltransferase subunit H
MAVVEHAFTLGKASFGAGKPVLIGSLFYKSDRKVKDHAKGEIDSRALSRELRQVATLKERVGLEHAIDVIAETPCAMEKYLEILADATEDPLFIGGMNEETRVAGCKKTKELGIAQRCGINSVSSATTQYELDCIAEAGIESAIVQALDTSAVLPVEKLEMLKGELLGRCRRAGLVKVAVDVGIVDFTSAWLAAEAIKMISAELAIPAGCAPSNAAYQPLVSRRISRKAARSINVAMNTLMQLAGAGFIIYGPLKASTYVFEAAAIVVSIMDYGAKVSGTRVPDRDSPLFRYLPKLNQ